jgi:hypothetical protein
MPIPTTQLRLRVALVFSLLCGAATAAAAQTTTLDEGTFRILIGGREVGSESFSIRQSGTGTNATINARGTVTIDSAGVTEELQSALQVAGAALQPTVYNLRILHGQREEQITGRVAGGRFIAKILSTTGEELREYLVSNRAILIDQGITHHYYFLARRMQDTSMQIPIIIPRQSRQVSASVEMRGEEMVNVGNQRIAAQHLIVTPNTGNVVQLWVDNRARVLRLEIPASNFAARRTTPPR